MQIGLKPVYYFQLNDWQSVNLINPDGYTALDFLFCGEVFSGFKKI